MAPASTAQPPYSSFLLDFSLPVSTPGSGCPFCGPFLSRPCFRFLTSSGDFRRLSQAVSFGFFGNPPFPRSLFIIFSPHPFPCCVSCPRYRPPSAVSPLLFSHFRPFYKKPFLALRSGDPQTPPGFPLNIFPLDLKTRSPEPPVFFRMSIIGGIADHDLVL